MKLNKEQKIKAGKRLAQYIKEKSRLIELGRKVFGYNIFYGKNVTKFKQEEN
jgi:hypothetical protein